VRALNASVELTSRRVFANQSDSSVNGPLAVGFDWSIRVIVMILTFPVHNTSSSKPFSNGLKSPHRASLSTYPRQSIPAACEAPRASCRPPPVPLHFDLQTSKANTICHFKKWRLCRKLCKGQHIKRNTFHSGIPKTICGKTTCPICLSRNSRTDDQLNPFHKNRKG